VPVLLPFDFGDCLEAREQQVRGGNDSADAVVGQRDQALDRFGDASGAVVNIGDEVIVEIGVRSARLCGR
jgi:hypothetical protein